MRPRQLEIDIIRKTVPEQIAKEIYNVQPIHLDLFDWNSIGETEQWLISASQ